MAKITDSQAEIYMEDLRKRMSYEVVFKIDTDKAIQALENGDILPEYITYYLKRKESK